jgi:hypothetical protein
MSDHNSDFPSRVANIGQRMPAAEPLPPSSWRDRLEYAAWAALFIVTSLLMLATLALAMMLSSGPRRIDCTWAEISPDFTPAMREACRKASRA